MWPIQFAFRLRISCRIFLCSLTLSNTSSFLTWSVQLIFSWYPLNRKVDGTHNRFWRFVEVRNQLTPAWIRTPYSPTRSATKIYINWQRRVNYGGHSYQRLLQLCIFHKCLHEHKSHNSDVRTAIAVVGNIQPGNSDVLLSIFPLGLKLVM
jgi:hypothetical protein